VDLVLLFSDQGSEYDSKDFIDLIESLKIKISMNRKASPWERGSWGFKPI